MAQRTVHLGRKFRCEFARKTNWPNERPTAARRLMNECIAGFACLDDHHLFMGLYITTMGSWIHGLMGLMDSWISWMMDPRDGLL